MSDWQTRLRNGSIDSLEALPEKFGLGEDDDSPAPNILHRYPDGVLFLVSPVHASSCRFCTRRRKVGDSMMLSARRLEHILQKLREIPHIEIIRIGSRITAHLPERVTQEFCEMVQHYRPIFMNTHFNHASELTPAARCRSSPSTGSGLRRTTSSSGTMRESAFAPGSRDRP